MTTPTPMGRRALDQLDGWRGRALTPAREWIERLIRRELDRAPFYPPALTLEEAAAEGIATVGRGTYGDAMVFHYRGEPARLTIGNYCSTAFGVRLVPGGNHNTRWITTYPFPEADDRGHPFSKGGGIVIGNDVWLGLGSTVLSGATIGDGVVVGAGSVVTGDVPPYALVAGAPAQVVAKRFPADQVQALLRIAWWDWPDAEIQRHLDLLLSEDIQQFIDRFDPHRSPAPQEGRSE